MHRPSRGSGQRLPAFACTGCRSCGQAWSFCRGKESFATTAEGNRSNDTSSGGRRNGHSGSIASLCVRCKLPGIDGGNRNSSGSTSYRWERMNEKRSRAFHSRISTLDLTTVSGRVSLLSHLFGLRYRGDRKTRCCFGQLDGCAQNCAMSPLQAGWLRPSPING